jgi:Ca2+-binding RTX toxin-like protein
MMVADAQADMTVAQEAVYYPENYDMTQEEADAAFAEAEAFLDGVTAELQAAETALDAAEAARDALPDVGVGKVGIFVTGNLAQLNAFFQTEGAISFTGEKDAFGEAAAEIDVAVIDGETAVPLGTVTVDLAEQWDVREGTEGHSEIAGDAGRDHLIGRQSADRMDGGAGTDELDGQGGNDRLDGGADADMMSGGMGNDAYFVDHAGDVVSETASYGEGGGIDTVFSSIDYELGQNVEALRLQGSASHGVGNAGANVLVGTDNDDSFEGGYGNDRIVSKGGADILNGNHGADILDGGTGADTFVLSRASDSGVGSANRDFINGFQHRHDSIDVSAVDADVSSAEDDAFLFIGARGFDGTAGQLRYQELGGHNAVIVEGVPDGDGTADFQMFVNGSHWMSGTDFVL